MICNGCGRDEDCRCGYCFDCATAGEERAAKRTVWQHICKGIGHLFGGWRTEARIDFRWAFERLTGTGDYDPRRGEFRRYL